MSEVPERGKPETIVIMSPIVNAEPLLWSGRSGRVPEATESA